MIGWKSSKQVIRSMIVHVCAYAMAAAFVWGMGGSAGAMAPAIPAAGDTIMLPDVPETGDVSVEEAIRRRRSVRNFRVDALEPEIVSRLLWAAQGITEPGFGLRSAPSAGATYPLEIFIATGEHLARYMPETA